MAIVASTATSEFIQGRKTEIKARGTLGIPGRGIGGAFATALATVTDEEREVRSLAIDGDNDLLSAVEGRVRAKLGVVHGDDVVGVDVVKSQSSLLVAHDGTHVLVLERCAASIDLLDIIIVSTETRAAEDGLLSQSTSEETGGGSDELSLHLDCCVGKGRKDK